MDRTIRQKLRSQRGASISFALLLFLVCAVVGSVVLVAGTTAAGRISQVAEADQRYYSVTSAAELLRKEIEGTKVITTEITEQTYVTDAEGHTSASGEPSVTRKVKVGNKADIIIPGLQSQSYDSIIGNAASRLRWVDSPRIQRQLTLTAAKKGSVSLSDDAVKKLAITATENLSEDGTLTIELYNQYDANGATSVDGNRYKLLLTFQADISQLRKNEDYGPMTGMTDEDEGYQRTKTTIRTQEYTWWLTGITTVGKR